MRFIIALLLVAGCSSISEESVAEATIIRPGNFTPGSGTIQSVGVLRHARPADAPATADTKGKDPDRNLYRLYLHMDAGGFQSVDIDNSRFMAGEAVELTNDGRVVRVTGSSLNQILRR